MNPDNTLEALLRDTRELEAFLHDVISPLAKRHQQPGEDVTRYVEQLGLKIPEALKGLAIEWAGKPDSVPTTGAADEHTLTLVRPGTPAALGLTIGCISVGRFKICLECSWIFCRIVIKGRF